MAQRRAGRRSGRAHVADALRVVADRLRDLVRRRCDGAHLRDVLRGAGPVDPARLGRQVHVPRDQRARQHSCRGPRRPADTRQGLDHRRRRPRRAQRDAATASPTRSSRTGRTSVATDALATIIYTSGTTGRPKGCELTHLNFLSEVGNIVHASGEERGLSALFQEPDAATLLFLPLAHVFARAVEVGCVMARGRVGHTADVKNLLADLERVPADVHPVGATGVREGVQLGGAKGRGRGQGQDLPCRRGHGHRLQRGARRRRAGARPQGQARRLRQARLFKAPRRPGRPDPLVGLRRGAARHPARPLLPRHRADHRRGLRPHGDDGRRRGEPPRPQQDRHGGPAPARRHHPHRRRRRGGRQGRRRLPRYYNNEAATAEAFTDGWFRTGDIGELDDDGYLRITGRKKELIVTAGGKNVAPAVLEDRLRAHRLVSQCMVVGDAQPYIACLITLDEEALPAWLATHSKAEDGRSRRQPTTPMSSPRSSRPSTTQTRRFPRRRRSSASRSSTSTGRRTAARSPRHSSSSATW